MNLIDNNKKVVARVAVAFPVEYGSLLKTGKVDQATYDCVENIGMSLGKSYGTEIMNGGQHMFLSANQNSVEEHVCVGTT